MVDRRRADIHAGVTAGQTRGANAGVSQSIVRNFQQVTMLRVELLGFARAHAEGGSVEPPNVVDHARGKGIASPDLVGRRMVEGLRRESVGGNPAYTGAIVPKEGPERVHIRSTWD